MQRKPKAHPRLRLAGVELYFDDLVGAKKFYAETLGLALTGETPGHHAQLNAGDCFVCLEAKGAEEYPSKDKGVLFFEVSNLGAAIAKLGRDRILASETGGASGRRPWAVLHDPEGHNILLIESRKRRRKS